MEEESSNNDEDAMDAVSPAVIESGVTQNAEDDDDDSLSDIEKYWNEDDCGGSGGGGADATIATMLEPVKAEPLEDSFRDLPVVSISNQDEQLFPTPAVAMDDQRNTAISPLPEPVSVRPPLLDVEATPIMEPSVRSSSFEDDYDEDELLPPLSSSQFGVAQFVSARVIRQCPESDLGFRIRVDHDVHIITDVKKDGILANTPVLAGDKLISINNNGCLGMKFPGINRLLETAEGHATITAQNPRGDPSLVECYVAKPNLGTRLGLDLVDPASHRHHRAANQLGPMIATVNPKGLMVDSLLNPGDRILSINGKSVEDVASAKRVLRKIKSPHITILARTKAKTAAVVTTEPETGTRSRRFDLYGIPARARRLRQGGEGRGDGNKYDSARIGCNMAAIVLAIMMMVTPARTGMFITARNWVFAVFTIFGIVNAPWQFRKEGARISPLQLFVNALVLSWMAWLWFGSDDNIPTTWFCAFYFPLLVLINVPTCFPNAGADDSDSGSEADVELAGHTQDGGAGVTFL